MRRLFAALLLAAPLAVGAQSADGPDDDFADLEALLDEPVQTAATYTQRSSEAPASVTIIGADEIDRAGYRTLGEALATVRGFYVTDDRNYQYIGVRGLSRPSDYNNRIAMLVDGAPVQDGVSGAASIGLELGVPMTAVERIEVIRGPGSTLYGTGAMFAVVNVILKDTRTLEGARGVFSAGAFGALRGEAVAAATLADGVDASVAVFGLADDGPDPYFAEFDAPETGGGVAADLDWEEARGMVAALQAGPARLDIRYNERDKGIPTGAYETVFGLESWTRDRSASAALRVESELSPTLSASASGALRHYYYWGVYPYDDGDGSGPYDAFDDSHSSQATAEGRLLWDVSATNRVVLGAEVRRDFESQYRGYYEGGETYVDFNDPYTSGAVYGQVESQLGPSLAVTVGARVDAVRDESAVSPRGALVFTPGDRTSLKLIGGTAFRAPSTFELSYVDPFSGQIAATDLDPERVASAELVATHEVADGVRLEGSAFYTHVTDLIDYVEVDPEAGTTQLANVGRAAARGLEAGVLVAAGGWRTRASYGLQEARDLDLEASLTNAPLYMGKVSAFGPLGRDLWLSVGARAESGRKTVYDTMTDAYAVVDASLSADVFGEAARITLGVRNALDAEYALPGGFEHTQIAIPQRPRTAFARVDVRL